MTDAFKLSGCVQGRVLFIGDSITDGGQYISFLNTYLNLYLPDSGLELINLGVSGENLSGLTEKGHPYEPRPCGLDRIEKALELLKPDWAVLCYGINDGIYQPFSQERFEAYQSGCRKAVAMVKSRGIKIAFITPAPFDCISADQSGALLTPSASALGDEEQGEYKEGTMYRGYDRVMKTYSQWILDELKSELDIAVDMRTPMLDWAASMRAERPMAKTGDGVHPSLEGHMVMAKAILKSLFGIGLGESFRYAMEKDGFRLFNLTHQRDSLAHRYYKELIGHGNPDKEKPITEEEMVSGQGALNKEIELWKCDHPELFLEKSCWKGHDCDIVHFKGYEVTVVKPSVAARGKPWVWRTEFLGAFPSADLEMLARGWHLVYINLSDRFGAPEAVELMGAFGDWVRVRYGLCEKSVLFGFSRGGLYALHYAGKYPSRVGAMYLDAPVIDLCSWPGGKGSGVGSEWDWERCLEVYGFEEPEAKNSYEKILKASIEGVLDGQIPLVMVAGDSDEVVPYEENGRILEEAYKDSGLPFLLILKPGIGHHPHSLEDPTPIVDFLCTEAGGSGAGN